MSVARKSLTIAAVTVAAMAATGTAIGATRYVITSLSQISPSVVKQLQGTNGGDGDAYVANGTAGTLAKTATTVATLVLPKAPALAQATVTVSFADGPSGTQATCALNLDGKPIAPPVTFQVPGELTPLDNAGSGSTTLYAPVTAAGKLTLTCLDVSGVGSMSAQGSIAAVTTRSASLLSPAPA